MNRRRLFVSLAFACWAGGTCAQETDKILVEIADGNAPLSAATLPEGGLLVEITRAAFASAPSPIEVAVQWRAEGAFELGVPDAYLPARRPDCDGVAADVPACAQNLYSAPLAELVVLAFVRERDEARFGSLQDLSESRLCYAEYSDPIHTQPVAPSWVAENIWTTVPADSLGECFSKLERGEVDVVAADEYRGVSELFQRDLTKTVVPLPTPLGTQTLHLAIEKTHWRATAHLYRLDAGLARLRQTGEYAEIVARQTSAFWERLKFGN